MDALRFDSVTIPDQWFRRHHQRGGKAREDDEVTLTSSGQGDFGAEVSGQRVRAHRVGLRAQLAPGSGPRLSLASHAVFGMVVSPAKWGRRDALRVEWREIWTQHAKYRVWCPGHSWPRVSDGGQAVLTTTVVITVVVVVDSMSSASRSLSLSDVTPWS